MYTIIDCKLKYCGVINVQKIFRHANTALQASWGLFGWFCDTKLKPAAKYHHFCASCRSDVSPRPTIFSGVFLSDVEFLRYDYRMAYNYISWYKQTLALNPSKAVICNNRLRFCMVEKQNFNFTPILWKGWCRITHICWQYRKFDTSLIYVIKLSEPHPSMLFFRTDDFKPIVCLNVLFTLMYRGYYLQQDKIIAKNVPPSPID